MFQDYALFPHRDVAGNVAFGLRMAGAPRRRRERRTSREVLELVGLAGSERPAGRDAVGRRAAAGGARAARSPPSRAC